MAVDSSSGPSDGDVYVTDPANHRVEKFGPAGEFILMFGQEVNESAVKAAGTEAEKDVCTQASADVCQVGASGSSPGDFTSPAFVAVDNSAAGDGDLYVGDTGDGIVSKFDSAGGLISAWGNNGSGGSPNGQLGGFTALQGITVDPSGNLFVAGTATEIQSYDMSGGPTGKIESQYSPAQLGLSVDAEDNLYEANEQILKISDTGALLAYLEAAQTASRSIPQPMNFTPSKEAALSIDSPSIVATFAVRLKRLAQVTWRGPGALRLTGPRARSMSRTPAVTILLFSHLWSSRTLPPRGLGTRVKLAQNLLAVSIRWTAEILPNVTSNTAPTLHTAWDRFRANSPLHTLLPLKLALRLSDSPRRPPTTIAWLQPTAMASTPAATRSLLPTM